MWFLLVYCSGLFLIGAAQFVDYHQDDYDVKFERAELIWYDKRYIRDLKVEFPFFNRSTRVFNASGYLLMDQTTMDLTAEGRVYKYLSNEYRYFPIELSGNVCEEYANNRLHCRDALKNKTNVPNCPLKKGFYYAYNVLPDYSKLPPFMPHGRFKGVAKLFYAKQLIAEAHGYAEIMAKPLKWT